MKKENVNSIIPTQVKQPCFSGFLYAEIFMLSMSMDMR